MLHRGVSDAKKKALYESHVFGNGEDAAAPPASELSGLKLREVTGHDIFNKQAAPEVQSLSFSGRFHVAQQPNPEGL